MSAGQQREYTSSCRMRRHAPSTLLGVAAFVLYQTTFAAFMSTPFMDFWLFGSDSYRATMSELLDGHPMANYQTRKHPLFAVAAIPTHRVGRAIYSALDQPWANNLSLVFPAALFGGVSVAVSAEIFLVAGFTTFTASALAALYSVAAALWLFASFPESYSLTCLVTGVFLLVFLRDPKCARMGQLVVVNALACLIAPQQLLLCVIPGVAWLRRLGLKKAVVPTARYGVGLALLWGLPYALMLMAIQAVEAIHGVDDATGLRFISNELDRWANLSNYLAGDIWALVVSNFVSFSQATPLIDPRGSLDWGTVIAAAPATLLLAALPGVYTVAGMYRALRNQAEVALPLAAYVLAYVLFFVYYNPGESFLHSGPVVLAVWLAAHLGFRRQQRRPIWRFAIVGILAVTLVLNVTMVARMHEHVYWGLRVDPPPPGLEEVTSGQ